MKKILIASLLTALTACTTTEKMDWVLVGGSKADGNIILGIDVPPKMGITETIVEWNVNEANAEATRRCQNWGYGGAEIYRNGQFPILKTCHPQGISPCWSKTYRIEYQCTDGTVYLPDGSLGYHVTCGGTNSSMGTCIQKAGKACGAAGYKVIGANGEAIPYSTARGGFISNTSNGNGSATGGYSSSSGSIVTRDLFIKCN